MTQQVPAGKIRCPNCGALNAESAEWCGQCLQRFRAPEPPPPPPPPPGSTPAPGAEPQPVRQPEPEPQANPLDASTPVSALGPGTGAPPEDEGIAVDPASVGTKRGAFEVTEEGIQWTCRVCDSKNPIELLVCSACGSPFAETVREQRADQIEGDPNNAALYSLFFPGAGHGYLGLWGDAVARAVVSLFAITVTLVAFLGQAPLVAAVFGLLSFALWVVAAHDAYREASHQSNQTLIKTRHYGFLMLGILALLFIMLMATYFGIRAQR